MVLHMDNRPAQPSPIFKQPGDILLKEWIISFSPDWIIEAHLDVNEKKHIFPKATHKSR